MAVVGVPKTIDNDILLMDKTFGFDTAVEEAQRAISSAYIEVEISYDTYCFLCYLFNIIFTAHAWIYVHVRLLLNFFLAVMSTW